MKHSACCSKNVSAIKGVIVWRAVATLKNIPDKEVIHSLFMHYTHAFILMDGFWLYIGISASLVKYASGPIR